MVPIIRPHLYFTISDMYVYVIPAETSDWPHLETAALIVKKQRAVIYLVHTFNYKSQTLYIKLDHNK